MDINTFANRIDEKRMRHVQRHNHSTGENFSFYLYHEDVFEMDGVFYILRRERIEQAANRPIASGKRWKNDQDIVSIMKLYLAETWDYEGEQEYYTTTLLSIETRYWNEKEDESSALSTGTV